METKYYDSLRKDLVEQFKDMPKIEALCYAVAKQLQDVFEFYEELRSKRNLDVAIGKQLDGIGNIVDLSRKEAGLLAGAPIPFPVIDDDIYRHYLIFKILKNTTNCTYPDIIKGFQMFWNYKLYYHEEISEPATMLFDCEDLEDDVDIMPLIRAPLLRAGGVGINIRIPIVYYQDLSPTHTLHSTLIADFTHRYWRDGETGVLYWSNEFAKLDGKDIPTIDGSFTLGEILDTPHYFDGTYHYDGLAPNPHFKDDQVHEITIDQSDSYTISANGTGGDNILNGTWTLNGLRFLRGSKLYMTAHDASIIIIKGESHKEEAI